MAGKRAIPVDLALFAEIADDDRDVVAVLDTYHGGERDPLTVETLAGG